MESDSLIPDPANIVRKTVKDLRAVKTEKQQEEESWANLGRSTLWKHLLKPHLEERIEILRSMSEVDLDGSETATNVGIRFLLCSSTASEIQALIDLVEQTRIILDKVAKDKK